MLEAVVAWAKPVAKAIVAAVVPILVVAIQELGASGANWALALVTAVATSAGVWAKSNG